jgi:tight adherence protein B
LNTPVIISSCLIGLAVALGIAWGMPFLDRLTSAQVHELRLRMTALGVDQRSMTFYLRLWIVALAATIVLLGPIMPPVALGLAALIYSLPRLILGVVVRRRSIQLRDQIVEASVTLANSARSGMSLAQGIKLVASEAPEPLAYEFRRISNDYERGKPLLEALRDTQMRLRLDSFTLFSCAVRVCQEQGGKITDALERISNSLAEHQRLERKIEAETAGGRRVVVMLCFFPVAFLVFYSMAFREGASLLFTTMAGQAVLLVVGCLVYFSVQWCRKIINIEL